MRQFLLVLGIASIFFAQSMSAQMDDMGTGDGFPTGDCKVAASNFVRNVTGNNKRKIVYDAEQNIYRQLIDNLNEATQKHQANIDQKLKMAAKGTEDQKKNTPAQIDSMKKNFEREKRTLDLSCGEHIKWADGMFERVQYGSRSASPSGGGEGSN